MSDAQIDRLDALVPDVAKNKSTVGYLSTGEKLYVYLAANRIDLLETEGYTIAEALVRIGDSWVIELLSRWRYAGNPKNFG
ncbi:MAG: hypothetical protein LBE75_05230 [Burkholderiales bacterium]|jgi:hypothetical protein|nr:hypothetical protein [Burkholderiales bacterium]